MPGSYPGVRRCTLISPGRTGQRLSRRIREQHRERGPDGRGSRSWAGTEPLPDSPGRIDHVSLLGVQRGRTGEFLRGDPITVPYLVELRRRPGEVQPARYLAQALPAVE